MILLFTILALFGLGEGPLEVMMELIAMRWFESVEANPGHTLPPSLEFAFGFNSAFGLAGALVCMPISIHPLLYSSSQSDPSFDRHAGIYSGISNLCYLPCYSSYRTCFIDFVSNLYAAGNSVCGGR